MTKPSREACHGRVKLIQPAHEVVGHPSHNYLSTGAPGTAKEAPLQADKAHRLTVEAPVLLRPCQGVVATTKGYGSTGKPSGLGDAIVGIGTDASVTGGMANRLKLVPLGCPVPVYDHPLSPFGEVPGDKRAQGVRIHVGCEDRLFDLCTPYPSTILGLRTFASGVEHVAPHVRIRAAYDLPSTFSPRPCKDELVHADNKAHGFFL